MRVAFPLICDGRDKQSAVLPAYTPPRSTAEAAALSHTAFDKTPKLLLGVSAGALAHQHTKLGLLCFVLKAFFRAT